MMQDFSQRLREARLSAGLSLDKAADQWGIPRRSLARYEAGGTPRAAARLVLERVIQIQEDKDNGRD